MGELSLSICIVGYCRVACQWQPQYSNS